MVSRFYPPDGGGGVSRTIGFVRHLPDSGIRPVVLTGPGDDAWVRDPGLLGGLEGVETLRAGGARLPRGGARRPGWLQAAARLSRWFLVPDSYAAWRKPAARLGLERLRAGDIRAIYSTSPPDTGHLVALDLARASGLPWVADFRDPWVGLGYASPPTPWHAQAHEGQLRAVLGGATRVLAATEGTRRWLLQYDPSAAARARVVPNGYEAGEWAGVEPHRFEEFTVVHAGRISGGRTLAPFLAGLARFLGADAGRRARTRVRLYGPRDAREDARVRDAGLGDVVSFEGVAPHADILRVEAGAHVLLLLKHLEPRFRDLIPGKLYEYIGAGRPVLAVIPEGPAAELVRGLRLGRVAPPESPERIAEALEEAWSGRLVRGPVGEDALRFTRKALAGQLAAVVEEVTA